MKTWSKMSRDERTAAIATVPLTHAEALRLARVHGTAAAAILSHATRSGISVADDSTVNGGHRPADASRPEKPPTVKRLPDQATGGDHDLGQPSHSAQNEPASRQPTTAPASTTVAARHRDYPGTGWTDKRVAALPEQLGQGLSAADIAATLGGDLSRNAVIGKAHRLGLSLNKDHGGGHRHGYATTASPKIAAERRHQPRQPKPKTEPRPPRVAIPKARPDVPEPVFLAIPLLELGHDQCRYPSATDDPAEITFCGAPQFNSRAYCEYHSRIVYIPATVRDRTDRRLGVSP